MAGKSIVWWSARFGCMAALVGCSAGGSKSSGQEANASEPAAEMNTADTAAGEPTQRGESGGESSEEPGMVPPAGGTVSGEFPSAPAPVPSVPDAPGGTEAAPSPPLAPTSEPGAGDATGEPGLAPDDVDTPGEPEPTTPDPGTEELVLEPGSRAAERAALEIQLSELDGLDAAGLQERYPAAFGDYPGYSPEQIIGLDLIQDSGLALMYDDVELLAQRGFVISAAQAFPTFSYGYSSIYAQDLPVYISADAILESVHRSYDGLLERLEVAVLMSELSLLLDGMREGLSAGVGQELGTEVRADADVFLAVASSLLQGQTVAPVAGGAVEKIDSLVDLATTAEGVATIELFGTARADEDFSQFKPRGHYTNSEELERYFKAMIWLGRVDLRLLETQSDGTRALQRRSVEGMLLLDALVDDTLRGHFATIDDIIGVFVGEPDYMELGEVFDLRQDLGISDLADVTDISDEAIEQAILDGEYGAQRISSHIMINGLAEPGTLPLSLSFALLGQRYVIDSHVFSNVVYDRAGEGTVPRMLPDPLDAAFAVLGNNQAAALLQPELEDFAYAPDLAAMRVLADEHPAEFWDGTLYNLWLGALRELSPNAIAASENADAVPATFRTEAWGRRLLNTELASWAELRHDTLLYAKQSYTGGSLCEFPTVTSIRIQSSTRS